jgi:cystathionine beta-lyase family protein involved in aluminum resistance
MSLSNIPENDIESITIMIERTKSYLDRQSITIEEMKREVNKIIIQ